MPFGIIQGDITDIHADVIVNTANPRPVYGRGTDMAIYSAAGRDRLLKERQKIGAISAGETAVTDAFDLQAKKIIHTVGPQWMGGNRGEYETLASCYRKSLLLAKQLGAESIAFPLISSGTYRFPKDRALGVALSEIKRFLEDEEMDVTLVVYDRQTYELSEELSADVRAFINRRNAPPAPGHANTSYSMPVTGALPDYALLESAMAAPQEDAARQRRKLFRRKKAEKIADLPKKIGESYRDCLFRLIDERGLTDAEVYKKANIDRRLFSKIRSSADYHPKKPTVMALAMALELDMDETKDLAGRAGIALSDASLFDLIIEYCIENRIYDIFTVNSILFEYDQPLLGGV